MKITFQYFKGCRDAGKALNVLEETLAGLGISATPELIEVNDLVLAHAHHFLGSPTIQVNGQDIEKDRRNDTACMGCRIYRTGTGSSGVPSKVLIAAAIRDCQSPNPGDEK